MLLGIAAILVAILADQFSKWWIIGHLVAGSALAFGDFFNVVKVWNSGVSFSMFSNHGKLGVVVLSLVAMTVCLFLLHWMWRETNRLKIVALGLIIGGAVGNVIDRVRYGAVLDFLDFHFKQYHWPAFNMADTFICIGACILIFLEIFNHKKG